MEFLSLTEKKINLGQIEDLFMENCLNYYLIISDYVMKIRLVLKMFSLKKSHIYQLHKSTLK